MSDDKDIWSADLPLLPAVAGRCTSTSMYPNILSSVDNSQFTQYFGMSEPHVQIDDAKTLRLEDWCPEPETYDFSPSLDLSGIDSVLLDQTKAHFTILRRTSLGADAPAPDLEVFLHILSASDAHCVISKFELVQECRCW